MTSRDLGFVASRALAVLIAARTMGEVSSVVHQLILFRSTPQMFPQGSAQTTAYSYIWISLFSIGIQILLVWQLWLRSDRFGAREQVPGEGSEPVTWVQAKKLILSGLGLLLIVWGLEPFVRRLIPSSYASPTLDYVFQLNTGSAFQFLVGVILLVAAYGRSFSKAANWPRSSED